MNIGYIVCSLSHLKKYPHKQLEETCTSFLLPLWSCLLLHGWRLWPPGSCQCLPGTTPAERRRSWCPPESWTEADALGKAAYCHWSQSDKNIFIHSFIKLTNSVTLKSNTLGSNEGKKKLQLVLICGPYLIIRGQCQSVHQFGISNQAFDVLLTCRGDLN